MGGPITQARFSSLVKVLEFLLCRIKEVLGWQQGLQRPTGSLGLRSIGPGRAWGCRQLSSREAKFMLWNHLDIPTLPTP